MDWFDAHPVPLEAVRAFVDKAMDWPDPLVRIALRAESPSERAAWLLLGCALQQRIALSDLTLFMESLYRSLGSNGLVALPAPRETTIRQSMAALGKGREWELAPQVPGIVWSVGQFVRSRGMPFAEWLDQTSPRDIWRDCGEIHYMGRSSPLRPKILAFLHRIAAPAPAGLGWILVNEGGRPPLPASPGARRWLAWIGPYEESGYADASTALRMRIVVEAYGRIKPEAPWKATHGLQFFTEPFDDSYLCAKNLGGCYNCPLTNDCPRKRN